MYTSHGHQIIGTPVEPSRPEKIARCGGPMLCTTCALESQQTLAVIHEVNEANRRVIKDSDLDSMYRWGRNFANNPEYGSAILAGQYMAMASGEEERAQLENAFYNGIRSATTRPSAILDGKWALKDWQDYHEHA